MARKLSLLVLFPLVCWILSTNRSLPAQTITSSAPEAKAARAANRVPLYFESNQGQLAGEVQFLARASSYKAYLTGKETVLEFQGKSPADVHLKLLNALKPESVRGEERQTGVVNYLIGDSSHWHTQIPTYAGVRYSRVYPGVDMVYRGTGKELEFEFQLAAGVSPEQIRMAITGADSLQLSSEGDLRLQTSAGSSSIRKPVAYQLRDGSREPVDVSFQMAAKDEVAFKLGAYDRTRPLIIDPTVSTGYATYLGSGLYGDTFTKLAVDSTGAAYICGYTTNNTFPVNGSPYQSADPYGSSGVAAGFVSKISADGSTLVYSTYIGGTNTNASTGVNLNAIAVNANGNAFVGGVTDDNTFPVTKAFRSTYPNSRGGSGGTTYENSAGVVLELTPSGSGLVFSSFLGGGDSDSVLAIALDSSSNVYVTGTNIVSYSTPSGTMLTSSAFPVTGGVVWGDFDQSNANIGSGFVDSFAAKISPPSSGNATLSYSTVIGGTSYVAEVYGEGVAVDSSNNAYFTGVANCDIGSHGGASNRINMTHANPASSEYVNNVWVLSLNPTATAVNYLDYLGGNSPGGTFSPDTSVAGIAVDSNSIAYVTGVTEANNFQTTTGAYQATKSFAGVTSPYTLNEQSDGYLTMLSSTGAINYSTYLNGSTLSPDAISLDNSGSGYADGTPQIGGIALDSSGNVAVAGITATSNFPVSVSGVSSPMLSAYTACTIGINCSGFYGFLSKFTSSGSLYYSALAGDGGEYSVTGVAANGTDTYFLLSESGNDLATGSAYDANNSSGYKDLLVHVSDSVGIATTLTVADASANYSASDQTVTLSSTVSATSTVNAGTVTYTVKNGATVIGTAVTSGTVSAGQAPSTDYTLPGGTAGGSYTISAAYSGATGIDASTGNGTLTVTQNQAPLSVTGAPSSSAYGSTFTVSTSGGSGSGSLTFSASGACSNSDATITMIASTGSCSISATKGSDGTYASATSATVTTSATQAALAITASSPVLNYGSAVPTITPSYTTFVNGDSASSLTTAPTCSTTYTATTDPGSTATTSCTGAVDANYSISYVSGVVTVTKATPAISISNIPASAIYGSGFTAVINYTGNGSPTKTVASSTLATCTVAGNTVSYVGVGTCTLTASATTTTDYNAITGGTQSFSVSQAPLTITASSPTLNYGSAVPTISPSYATFVNGDTAASLTTAPTCSTTYTTSTDPGNTATTSCTGAVDANYSISYVSGVVTVAKATPSISISNIPASAIYGSGFTAVINYTGNGSPTKTVASSTLATCTVLGNTVSYVGAGTCTLTASATTTADYNAITGGTQSFSVSQAPLTITASSPTLNYGSAVPTISPSYATFVNGDSASSLTILPTCSTTYTTSTDPGNTATTSCSGAADANYSFTYVGGTVTVTKTTPTISVNNIPVNALYGGSFTPAISYSGNGTPTESVASSTLAVCTAPAGKVNFIAPGTCTVTASATATTDYNAIAGGTQSFSVSRAPLVITASSPALNYGSAVPTISPSYATFVNGDSASSLTTAPTCSTTYTTSTDPGTTATTSCTGAVDASYSISYVSGVVTVTKATPGVSLTSNSNPAFVQNSVTLTATVSSAVSTPTGSVYFYDGTTLLGTGAVNASGVATWPTSSLAVGSHSITAAYQGDSNFTTATSSVLTELVQDFNLTITASGGTTGATSMTVLPGGTAVYTFTLSPVAPATSFPAVITLSASGLPTGATYSFSPATLAEGAGSTPVTLTVNLQQVSAAGAAPGVRHTAAPSEVAQRKPGSKLPFMALSLLLLPFVRRMRRVSHKLGRLLPLLILLVAGLAALAGMNGCGGASGYFGQAPSNYTITVTGTSGVLSHNTNVTLTIE